MTSSRNNLLKGNKTFIFPAFLKKHGHFGPGGRLTMGTCTREYESCVGLGALMKRRHKREGLITTQILNDWPVRLTSTYQNSLQS